MNKHTFPFSLSRYLPHALLTALLLGLFPAASAAAQARPASTSPPTAYSSLPDRQKANLTEAQWDQFAKNTRSALASKNDDLKVSALSNIIWYGPQLNVKSSLTKIMSIYRNNPDPQVRRMAVVAMGRMDSDFAMGYLKLMVSGEKNSAIRKTMRDVIHANRTGQWDAVPTAPSLAQKNH